MFSAVALRREINRSHKWGKLKQKQQRYIACTSSLFPNRLRIDVTQIIFIWIWIIIEENIFLEIKIYIDWSEHDHIVSFHSFKLL